MFEVGTEDEIFYNMEATITNISYRYRAPVRYIIFAAGFLLAGGIAALFFAAVTPWIFRAIMIFIMAVGFLGGLAFLLVYLKSINAHICFSQDSVILPYRHKRQPAVLAYSDITLAEEKYTYGRILRISTPDSPREYLIDECWLRKGEFDELLGMLREKTGA